MQLAEEAFKKVGEAHRTLTDPRLRKEYELTLPDPKGHAASRAPHRPQHHPQSHSQHRPQHHPHDDARYYRYHHEAGGHPHGRHQWG